MIIELSLPADWNEIIKAEKYLDVIRVLNTTYPNDTESRWAMLQALTGFKPPKPHKTATLGAQLYDAAEIIDNVFPALNFIYNNEPFLINPIKQFTLNNITYQGPTEKLLNQTGDEWSISFHAQILYQDQCHAERSRSAGQATADLKHLRTIVAANYHTLSPGGQRMPLDETTMEEDQANFETLPDEIVYGIMLWYNHCEDYWNTKYTSLYGEGDGETQLTGREVWNLIFELGGCQLGVNWKEVRNHTRQELYMAQDRLEDIRLRAETKR